MVKRLAKLCKVDIAEYLLDEKAVKEIMALSMFNYTVICWFKDLTANMKTEFICPLWNCIFVLQVNQYIDMFGLCIACMCLVSTTTNHQRKCILCDSLTANTSGTDTFRVEYFFWILWLILEQTILPSTLCKSNGGKNC